MSSIRLTLSIVAGLLIMQAGDVAASAFRVTPVQVKLGGKGTALLTLTNESTDALRFQLSAFAWTQSPTGELQLAPTTDVTFFPALVTLKAGEERKVRIGSNVTAGDVEKTYRVFFEELPPAETSEKKASEVRILTKMGVPVFVGPPKPLLLARITDIRADGGNLLFNVQNAGNAHYSIRGVRVTGTSQSGEKIFQREVDGWYVLAGGRREYTVQIPADVCAKVRGVLVEAMTDIATEGGATVVSAQQPFPAGSCRG